MPMLVARKVHVEEPSLFRLLFVRRQRLYGKVVVYQDRYRNKYNLKGSDDAVRVNKIVSWHTSYIQK
jgi:hypothetical protein